MPTKTTGAEFKKFYNDSAFWPDDAWHEGESVLANDVEVDEYSSIPYEAKVSIFGGTVFCSKWAEDNAPSFEAYFKRWRKQQNGTSLIFYVPKEKVEAVKAAVAEALK